MMVTLGANDKQFIEGRTVCPTPGLLVRFWSGTQTDGWMGRATRVLAAAPHNHRSLALEQVLFPSWLSHSVDRLEDGALDGGERRVAIAFNVHGWERT